MRQRRRLINAQQGRLAEFGLVAPKGPAGLKRLENALEDGAADLPGPVRETGAIRLAQIADLTEVIERPAAELEAATKTDDELRRSCTIPGIGPATAGAVAALAPDLDAFDRGRTVAAWPGLAPRQGSTGGKAKPGAVGKLGQATRIQQAAGDVRRDGHIGALFGREAGDVGVDVAPCNTRRRPPFRPSCTTRSTVLRA